MFTVYIYDTNWISVAIVEHVEEKELDKMVKKLKKSGFNVNAVQGESGRAV